jgi:hypothetical protein
VYQILASRSQHAAREILGDFRGVVMADGYGAYEALARAGPGFTLAHCGAHVRRKFIEAEAHYAGPGREVLDLIGQLLRCGEFLLVRLGERRGFEFGLHLSARLVSVDDAAEVRLLLVGWLQAPLHSFMPVSSFLYAAAW